MVMVVEVISSTVVEVVILGPSFSLFNSFFFFFFDVFAVFFFVVRPPPPLPKSNFV